MNLKEKSKKFESIKDVCESIWQIEERFDLLNFDFEGIKVWQHLRMSIYYEIAEKIGVLSNPHPHKADKTPLNYLKIKLKRLLHGLFLNPFCSLEKVDALIFPHSRVKNIDGEYFDIYSKYLIDEFKNSGISYQALINADQGQYLVKASKNIKYLDILTSIKSLFRSFFKHTPCEQTTNIVNIIDNEIKNTFGCDIGLLTKFRKSAASFIIEYEFYKTLFKLKKPKKIFLVCSYTKSPIIKAAKELNIETIELQHGTLSKYHLGYSFPFLKSSLDYFPEKFYSWGKYWSELINFPIERENVINKGFTYFRTLKNRYDNIPRLHSQIIVVSQGAIGHKLAELLANKIPDLADYSIIYKLHPSEVEAENKYLLELSKYDNVKIVKDVDLYQVFAESAYIIGVFSTAIYEGIAFGCKPIVVDLPGIEYMTKMIEDYKIPVLSKNSDIHELIFKADKCNIDSADFF